ncbi:hypothetical protein DR62_06720 [Burkholderia thailandensis]|nr:hypothetical protein DR62_06720 [Burkholderia thailandensis]AOI51892.1 hypothetical protein WI24_08795 [Burkholderia thailandensis]AOJ50899.1 hypothetical protein AQ475_08700 [Burkholderia thailandensis]AVR26322.1 hypothetical protein A8H32_15655 [Burkholderia thailandensis]PJO70473.1 hypothetical protein CWD92_20735 [Burkholderia thailandensis]
MRPSAATGVRCALPGTATGLARDSERTVNRSRWHNAWQHAVPPVGKEEARLAHEADAPHALNRMRPMS